MMTSFHYVHYFSDADTDWTVRTTVDFKPGPMPRGHQVAGRHSSASPGDMRAILVLQMDQGRVQFSLIDGMHKDFPKRIVGDCRRIDLGIAYYHQGAFETLSLRGKPGKLTEALLEIDKELSYSWDFDRSSPEIRKFLSAIAPGYQTVHLAVSGYCLDSAQRSAKQRWPAVAEPKRPLVSLSSVMTSTDKDLVFLAPTVPADEDRVLRVHQGILCEASSYFATLLKSDFAEASDLRQKQQLCSAISSSLNLSSSPTEACRKQLGVNTSQTPTVKVDDITYAQLQTVLFFIFTGEAVFERRPCNYEASTDTRSNDSWTASDENACPSYWETPVRSTASLVESNLAWWDGQLEPANAFDMFRIADKYCIDGLRSAALQHIAKDISKSTLKTDLEEREEIIMFPEICEVYRNFCKVWYLALGSELDKHIEDTLGLDVSELANAVPLSIESLYFED